MNLTTSIAHRNNLLLKLSSLRWARCSGSSLHRFSISTAHYSATSPLRASLHRQALARGHSCVHATFSYHAGNTVALGSTPRMGGVVCTGQCAQSINDLSEQSVFRLRRPLGPKTPLQCFEALPGGCAYLESRLVSPSRVSLTVIRSTSSFPCRR